MYFTDCFAICFFWVWQMEILELKNKSENYTKLKRTFALRLQNNRLLKFLNENLRSKAI